MLDLDYDITRLKGADYNPRQISEDDLATLRESITTLGLVKPLIVRGDTLVAGHQRTKSLRALGMTKAAVYQLSADTSTYDEVRFNQLHNGTDLDLGDEGAIVSGLKPEKGFQIVQGSAITGDLRSKGAVIRSEICDLIYRYGPWGGVVATYSGRVIHAAQYALCAAITRTPVAVYAVPDAEADLYRSFLDRQYGVFCYDRIKRDTFVQSLAQLPRLRKRTTDQGDGMSNRSTLYEEHVLPFMAANRGATLLDFGAGQGDYVRHLQSKGYDAYEMEFFRRRGMEKRIDVKAVNRMVDRLIGRLSREGRFDVVVCDSVLNSVDSPEAERAVMACLNAFAKPGGLVFFSGRSWEEHEGHLRSTSDYAATRAHRRRLDFYDDQGFTALMREGRWFFQKLHKAEQVDAISVEAKLAITKHKRSSATWQVMATKVVDLEQSALESAIDFEFNMDTGSGTRLGRHEDVKGALRVACERK